MTAKKGRNSTSVDLAAFRKAVKKAETRVKETKADLVRAEKDAKGGK